MTIFQILIFSLIISLIITIIGFKKTVWFISIGYTMSIIAMAFFVFFCKQADSRPFNNFQMLLLIILGSRLGYYLIMMGSAKRLEKKQSVTYRKDPGFQKYEKSVPILFPWLRIYSLQNIKVYLE